MRTAAIIVAAGSGSRFGSDTPKQFLEINGRPVLAHTLERFQAAPSVDSVVIVLGSDRVETFDTSAYSKVTHVVAGGASRAASVLNGMGELDDVTEIVAVHDGARLLVSVAEIEATIAKAKETGAACLVAPVTDTIKSIRGGEVEATLDRDKLRRALTPQAFKIEVLKAAFENADLDAATTVDLAVASDVAVTGDPDVLRSDHLGASEQVGMLAGVHPQSL